MCCVDNVKTAVRFLTSDKLMALSPRHVTVSTVGVLPSMRRLTEDLPSVNLALSLHAPNQQLRTQIVPSASGSPIDKLMAAVDAHVAANPFMRVTDESRGSRARGRLTGVMIEYILIKVG
jgi:adenine C2-methylase RlmN of 23S rRNA A2503 and tRNA A37